MAHEDVEVYYFGCWDQPGHFWRSTEYAKNRYIEDTVGPNIHPRIDGGFCPGVVHPRMSQFDRKTRPEVEGETAIHHIDGWTVMAFWDRSVDKRGACNSNFAARGTYDFEQMKDIARARFPTVMNRLKFELVLIE